MLLVVDVGNTNTVLGIYDGDTLTQHWRISTDRAKTADEYGLMALGFLRLSDIDADDVHGVAVSCVMPPVLDSMVEMSTRYFGHEPLIVDHRIELGIEVAYNAPRDVGADRLVNAVAALARYGAPAIIADFGTATTLDVLSKDKAYLGGAILPGVAVSLEALFERASKLPRIELARPLRAIGRTTVESMQSGIIFGTVGAVDELIRRIRSELDGEPVVIATGGLASILVNESREIQVVDTLLTLEGLRIIYDRARPTFLQ